jgi:hypothetical protein
MGELDHPAVVEFPLRGEWTVERTPAHRIPSHGTDILGQRYAYDFIRTDGRAGTHVHPAGSLRWFLIGGRTQDCYGWGEPIHAVDSGEVVVASDGVAERGWVHSLRESWAALKTVRQFRRTCDPRVLAGNYVVIEGGGAFSLYAHLAPGTLAVVAGQQVSAGDVVGRVGHTGNSTAPHLHFQLMDSGDAVHARGVACAFADYSVERNGVWEPVHNGIPARLERLRVEAQQG